MLENKNILIGITGGISAYKICSLIRMYKKAKANVKVVVTPSALNFVTKLTLQTLSNNEVYDDNFEIDNYKPEHISLVDWADLFVIAPISANTISKISNGICDNLLTTTVCAFKKPILIAPAMNTNMWENPIIQDNIKKLETLGFYIINPAEGFLACGTNGVGRMAEIEDLFEKTSEFFSSEKKLKGKKILITAGGTKEKIDPVRYITNCSSGKMGKALVDASIMLGADVTLVSTFEYPKASQNIVVESALEMEKAVKENLNSHDCVIMAAAVADYRISDYSEQKIKKTDSEEITLKFKKNPDILKEISKIKGSKIIVGFSAESENLIENSKNKLKNKGCDFIIANDISKKEIGFGAEYNEVYIIDKNSKITHIEKDTKNNIARKILERIFE